MLDHNMRITLLNQPYTMYSAFFDAGSQYENYAVESTIHYVFCFLWSLISIWELRCWINHTLCILHSLMLDLNMRITQLNQPDTMYSAFFDAGSQYENYAVESTIHYVFCFLWCWIIIWELRCWINHTLCILHSLMLDLNMRITLLNQPYTMYSAFFEAGSPYENYVVESTIHYVFCILWCWISICELRCWINHTLSILHSLMLDLNMRITLLNQPYTMYSAFFDAGSQYENYAVESTIHYVFCISLMLDFNRRITLLNQPYTMYSAFFDAGSQYENYAVESTIHYVFCILWCWISIWELRLLNQPYTMYSAFFDAGSQYENYVVESTIHYVFCILWCWISIWELRCWINHTLCILLSLMLDLNMRITLLNQPYTMYSAFFDAGSQHENYAVESTIHYVFCILWCWISIWELRCWINHTLSILHSLMLDLNMRITLLNQPYTMYSAFFDAGSQYENYAVESTIHYVFCFLWCWISIWELRCWINHTLRILLSLMLDLNMRITLLNQPYTMYSAFFDVGSQYENYVVESVIHYVFYILWCWISIWELRCWINHTLCILHFLMLDLNMRITLLNQPYTMC